MKIDVLFIDTVCSKAYNYDTLENDSIGGTEGSTIRLATGFAAKGLKVAVVQKWDFPTKIDSNQVMYLPIRWLNQVRPKNVIHVRSRMYFHLHPDAKHFVWMHDACYPYANNISDWPEYTERYNVKCIAVSDWHVGNIKSIAPSLDVTRIYSPIDEKCIIPYKDNIDTNQLVWMSSPHKGLKEMHETLLKIHANNPKIKLVVFNPGYFEGEIINHPSVIMLPQQSRETMRNIVSQSLCLFYPTKFEETFGLVAAEANALGTPVACYKVAALAESCGNEFAENEEDLLRMITSWQNGNRPKVSVNPNFLFDNIWNDWRKTLKLD